MVSKSPVNLIRALETSVALTGGTGETTLKTIVIKANEIGSNGFIRVNAWFSMTNNANNKTVRIKLGTDTYTAQVFSSVAGGRVEVWISNKDMAVQTGVDNTGVTGTGTANTATDQNLTITGQLGTGTDTLTLLGYTVEAAYE